MKTKHRLSYILFLFVLIWSPMFGQTIQGTIISANDNQPMTANVLIKNQQGQVLHFAIANSNGQYQIELSHIPKEPMVIEVTKYGYFTQSAPLQLNNTQRLIYDFSLEENNIELKDINVKAKVKPIHIKNDTVTYDPKAFKDGSEMVVEDILRKLPGVKVLEDGSIQFKGKDVTKVLLEGDDLFDSNYVVGTRNISAEIIDKIQAIENFTENPLLRGLSDSQDVALNLKLKKEILDLSGNAYVGLGLEQAYNIGVNLIGLYQKHKNFTTLSSNNIGKNNSPYDYFTNQPSKEQQKVRSKLASTIIPNDALGSALENYRTYNNQTMFGSFSHIIKHNAQINSRINFNYFKDKIRNDRSTLSSYFLQNLMVTTADAKIKTPQLFQLKYDLTFKPNDNSLWEFTQDWFDEETNSTNQFTSNNTQDISTKKSINSYFLKSGITYTNRLKENKAMLFNAYFASNTAPQHFAMFPALNLSTDNYSVGTTLTQSVHSKKEKADLRGSLIGVDKKSNKYALMISNNWRREDFNSYLKNEIISIADNKLIITNYATTVSAFYKFKFKHFRIKPSISFINEWTDIQQDTDSSFSKHFIKPALHVNYKLNENTALFSASSYGQSAQPIRYFFKDYILESARTIKYNEPNFTYQKVGSGLIGFSHYDLYNQFKFVTSLNYRQEKNQFLSHNMIATNYSIIKYVFFPESNTNIGLGINVEKYLPWIKSSIRLDSHNTIFKYKNLVNNSGIRDNKSFMSFNEFYVSTAFKLPVNFQNTLQVKYYQSRAKETIPIENTSIQNQFKALFNTTNSKLFASALIEYFNPNMRSNNSYTFLDIDIRYILSPRLKLILEAKNITGNKTFNLYQISDFYKLSQTLHLNEPYVLLRVDFRF